jgi:hypothetical protein
MARSAGLPARLRNEGEIARRSISTPQDTNAAFTESWVEISSQPSSSSLSSIGDEIVTTGLRVQHDPRVRRRRRAQAPGHIQLEQRQASTSSQEEYEESESEEDPAMTSSNEHIIPTTSIPRPEYDAGSDSDDDDENSTALGRRTDAGPNFTPQPNAFSHPPSTSAQRHGPSSAGSYFPPHAPSRHTYPSSRFASRQHSAYNNHQADHDAALRASLTTLLSIGAAAARGLPKRNQNIGGTTVASNEPLGLRFVPESELMGPEPAIANTSRPLSPSTRARSSPSVSSQEAVEKGKRKASPAKPTGEKVRALKKKRMQALEEESLISPTLLTWVMSAGVVVLVSVVGFGAGYVIGREVGRQEAMAGLNGTTLVDSSTCGREAVRTSTGTLRRFKWGIGGAARAVIA